MDFAYSVGRWHWGAVRPYGLLFLAWVFAPRLVAEVPSPNVVLIVSDDQGWTDFGFMGHPEIRTPHLDALAAESAVFRHGYVPTALCRPSLLTLISGLYAHQHRTTGNDPSPQLADVNSEAYAELRSRLIQHVDNVPCLPRLLSSRNYWSHQSGKWWEGSYRRGGFTHGMTRGFPESGGRHGDDGLVIGRDGMLPVLQFMDQAVGCQRPFFVWYAPFMPHAPHNPPARLLKNYDRAGRPLELSRYWAMCEWFDETCGVLLAHLDRSGQRENTVVVFVTDNGWIQQVAADATPGWRRSFAPRSKQSPCEGGVRTPILIRWPGHIPPGDRTEWISSVDIMPTILDAAGIDKPANLPGRSLLPILQQRAAWEPRLLFGEAFAHDVADLERPESSLLFRWCIDSPWKLVLAYDGRAQRYADVSAEIPREPALYRLDTDPHERHNLAGQYPETVHRLSQALRSEWDVSPRRSD